MKIIKNEFFQEFDTWDDPGDYPSNAGSGPLPSYTYFLGLGGEIRVEKFPGKINGVNIEKFANKYANVPVDVSVKKWNCEEFVYEVNNCIMYSYVVIYAEESEWTGTLNEDDYEIDFSDVDLSSF